MPLFHWGLYDIIEKIPLSYEYNMLTYNYYNLSYDLTMIKDVVEMYSDKIRKRMKDELDNCGSSMVINWNNADYGAFANFRMTVRYVADTVGYKVTTRRDGNRLIVTRTDAPAIASVKSGFVFDKADVRIAMETIDMLRPSPKDPNREYKNLLIDFLYKVCDQGIAYIDEQIKNGDRDPE